MPSGGGERDPVASMGGVWPNNHGVEISTVSTDAVNLNSRASIFSPVILTYKHLNGAWHG
jgi:hypothetical protein